MKLLKKTLFWLHLILGVAGGLVIALLAFTGAAMSFEPEILALVEPGSRRITPLPDAPRLSPAELLDHARAAKPDKRPGGLVLSADPTTPVLVQVAGGHAISLHPQTGEMVAERTPSNFFTKMLRLHINLTAGKSGSWIVTLSNVFFLILCVSGLYLWWPKTWRAIRNIARFNFRLKGRSLHWNLHNVLGIWSLAVLFVICLTGLVLSYTWAGDLLYKLTGSEKPASLPALRLEEGAPVFPLNEAFARADATAPGWESMAILPPSARRGTYLFIIKEAGAPHDAARARLTLHGGDASVLRWESYADFSAGRKLRSYMLPLHMGSIAGLPGRAIGFLACLAALGLVVTGYVLSWKRLMAWRKRRAQAAAPEPAAALPVTHYARIRR